ncbi:adoMet dependent proline di-methyltransferase domain-containing protein [Ditylenchus destructor]|uniref:AdoMet dependent proline di-methyltransferase domain-containing protein n=1 Tax=Ditylenchus destructor TaxID=166010 RepID=A0AAD4MTH5_9BILA|nr:adoMet dependent proline di-methyltransferase domain-containing protein [Ditylenchus destructor]
MDPDEKIYEKAHDHWSSVASDVDGMLGGFAQLHGPDIHDSKEFIAALRKKVSKNEHNQMVDMYEEDFDSNDEMQLAISKVPRPPIASIETYFK